VVAGSARHDPPQMVLHRPSDQWRGVVGALGWGWGVSNLDLRFFCNDFDREVSIREYLHALLDRLWDEGESFSGKRPFGNSGWEYDLYKPLIVAGVIKGSLDIDGYIADVDTAAGNAEVFRLIGELCGVSQ
jgi:hypothetical protein